MDQSLRVSKLYMKKHFLNSNGGFEMNSVGGKTEKAEEVKKALYLRNKEVLKHPNTNNEVSWKCRFSDRGTFWPVEDSISQTFRLYVFL